MRLTFIMDWSIFLLVSFGLWRLGPVLNLTVNDSKNMRFDVPIVVKLRNIIGRNCEKGK